ncbi:DUF4062 domain-containing protein [Photobacterium aphoticum]|uniref:DUF4062 domain-containing protein n=1 Tax=Photobacterium aphoticum TaxID=754436 RepID=A0A0J1GFT9_9GAMM|nr:DUF4062 domain-containing protein [Photobacterium aphoticum]KLU98564.1 hypothetical protein ABT58_21985 [Photobacterium aphoticum]PSU55388.1 DUF4062 domain-containing protein [Photobacterium aphoticum]GHA67582.1 hypothetical protein GCM10007086_46150 [Photobacterium aphoticum]
MAKPRIFVSSTYYDLKHVRSDIERFILEQGYDPILNERGHIAYGSREKLEEYCYKEVSQCDILVSIIGGRFGSSSTDEFSISNRELLEASRLGKQIYIFIDAAVASEYRTYQANKDIPGVKYPAVDDPKVYDFIEKVYNMPKNNTVHTFSCAADITIYLKEQWAGLFQRLLGDESKKSEVDIIQQLTETSDTLNQLVAFLVAEKQDSQVAISQILTINHPIFHEIERKADIPFRVFFETLGEMINIFDRLGYKLIPKSDFDAKDGYASWVLSDDINIVRISKEAFHVEYSDDDEKNISYSSKLKMFTSSDWSPELVEKDTKIPF